MVDSPQIADDIHVPAAPVEEPTEGATAVDSDDAPTTNVVSLFDRRPVRVPEVEESPQPKSDHPVTTAPRKDAKVDDIFAKLRAGSTEEVARASTPAPAADPKPKATSGDAAEKKPAAKKQTEKQADKKAGKPAKFTPVVDPARFSARDEAVAPVVSQIARKFKRVLADEQNNVLEHLRNKRSSLEIDAVLGTADEQAKRYAAAVSEDAMSAASAGAKSMKDARGTSKRVTQKAVGTEVTAAVLAGLVAMFREDARIAIGEAEGDRQVLAGLMRDVYRKWKMTGIDEHVDDVACAAYNAGAYLSLEPSTAIHWLVDAESACCGDCADNSLAGAVTKGQAFPTGDMHPMAHTGCRCLIGPASH